VADAVKTGLQSSAGTCDDVIGDLLFGEVAGTARLGIDVPLAQRCGAGADSPIHTQIAGQPRRAGLLCPLDDRFSGQLPPIAPNAHTRPARHFAYSSEVLDRSKMGTAKFMPRSDTLCRCGLHRHACCGSTLLVGKEAIQAAGAEMVGSRGRRPVRGWRTIL